MPKQSLSGICLALATLMSAACGGSAGSTEPAASPGTVTAAPHPDARDVERVVIAPSDDEAAGGGQIVTITDGVSIGHWTESAELFPTTWEKNSHGMKWRYRVSFQDTDGVELSAFFLGTTKGSPIEYKCFGLCASWWVAPALADGSQDMKHYHVMSDELWHPLAREWYLSH